MARSLWQSRQLPTRIGAISRENFGPGPSPLAGGDGLVVSVDAGSSFFGADFLRGFFWATGRTLADPPADRSPTADVVSRAGLTTSGDLFASAPTTSPASV